MIREGNRFKYQPTEDVMLEWFRLTTDIVHALFGIVYKDGIVGYHIHLIDRFVSNNFVVLQIYIHYYARVYRGTPWESLLWLIKLLNTRLLKYSNGNVGVYSPIFIEEGVYVAPGEFRGAL